MFYYVQVSKRYTSDRGGMTIRGIVRVVESGTSGEAIDAVAEAINTAEMGTIDDRVRWAFPAPNSDDLEYEDESFDVTGNVYRGDECDEDDLCGYTHNHVDDTESSIESAPSFYAKKTESPISAAEPLRSIESEDSPEPDRLSRFWVFLKKDCLGSGRRFIGAYPIDALSLGNAERLVYQKLASLSHRDPLILWTEPLDNRMIYEEDSLFPWACHLTINGTEQTRHELTDEEFQSSPDRPSFKYSHASEPEESPEPACLKYYVEVVKYYRALDRRSPNYGIRGYIESESTPIAPAHLVGTINETIRAGRLLPDDKYIHWYEPVPDPDKYEYVDQMFWCDRVLPEKPAAEKTFSHSIEPESVKVYFVLDRTRNTATVNLSRERAITSIALSSAINKIPFEKIAGRFAIVPVEVDFSPLSAEDLDAVRAEPKSLKFCLKF